MKLLVQARHMEVTPAIREHLESKIEKLPHFLTLLSVEVILGMDAGESVVEVVATARRKNTFVATSRHADMYTCIDQCLHKVGEQIRRHKDRVRDHQQKAPRGAGPAETPPA